MHSPEYNRTHTYSDTRGILSMPEPSLSQRQLCDLSGRVDTQVQLPIHVYSTCDTGGLVIYKMALLGRFSLAHPNDADT